MQVGRSKMKEKEWFRRFAERSDMSTRLIHLTKPSTVDGKELKVFEVMLKILEEKKVGRKYYFFWLYMWRYTCSVFSRCTFTFGYSECLL
jgi:hypothetical protein